jgi:hypothetical protein
MRLSSRNATALLVTVGLVGGVFSIQASAQSTVSGVYTGAGKPAALTQVTAHTGNPESGKPVTDLVFSTKDQAGDPKAAFDALFNKFGDAIVVKIFADGQVYRADLVHSALDTPGGSMQVFGVIKMQDFKMADGVISGHLTSGGPREFRDQKWEVDLIFQAKSP